MSIKRIVALLLLLCICLFPSCGKDGEQGTAGNNADDIMGGYPELVKAYTEKGVNATVTVTVDAVVPLENRFSVVEGEDGYTLTDLNTSETYTYSSSMDEEQVYKVAGYLPPYDTAYPSENGVYSSRLRGEIALEMLLEGSNLFSGYSSENVSLDGGCQYTATADTQLRSYSYEFAVNISDGDAVFPAKIKYFIEVNQ